MSKLEFNVLNYDFNGKKVVLFNIFNNIKVMENVEYYTKEYLKNPKEFKYESFGENKEYKGLEGITKAIDVCLMSQLWARREYEIFVGDAFEEDINKFEKWDCYKQAHANIDLIVDMCIKHFSK